jgi:hypothetical protein
MGQVRDFEFGPCQSLRTLRFEATRMVLRNPLRWADSGIESRQQSILNFNPGGASMAVVNPLPKEKAAPELHETYEGMIKRFGKVPNIFGAMAHRPNVLKNFLPFYGAVMNEGTVEPRFKELAYLKTSLINGCEY